MTMTIKVLIGTKILGGDQSNQANIGSQWQNYPKQQGHHNILINPGNHVSVNQCSDLFCIAKSRPTAVQIIKQACRKIIRNDLVEGPRGSIKMGTLESLGGNRLMKRRSERSEDGLRKLSDDHESPYREIAKEKELHLNGVTSYRTYPQQSNSRTNMVLNDARRRTCSYGSGHIPHSLLKQSSDSEGTSKIVRNFENKRSKASSRRTDVGRDKDISKSIHKKYSNKIKDKSHQRFHSSKLEKLSPFTFIHYEDTDSSSTEPRERNIRVSRTVDSDVQLNKSCGADGYTFKNGGATSSSNHEGQARIPFKKFKTPISRSDISCFDVSSSDESSSYSSETGHKLYDENVPLQNHLVIVLSSSGSVESISAHALLVPIIHLLTAYRAHRYENTSSPIYHIFTERKVLCITAPTTTY